MDKPLLEELINKHRLYGKLPQDFLSKPEKDSIPVRKLMFAIKCMIDQLEKRYPDKLENLVRLIIFKRNAQQRHQGFWRSFRALNSSLKKYQHNELLDVLHSVYKKLEKFNTFYYMLTPDMLLHIGASYISQLILLAKIRKSVLNVTNQIFGQLELNHWEKLSIFLVAVCADVNYLIPDQAKAICDNYNLFAEFLIPHDPRFPKTCDFDVIPYLIDNGSINSLPDTNKVLSMLNLDDEDLERANIEQNMNKIRNEILATENSTVDLGVSVVRTEVKGNKKRKITSVDSAFESDLNVSASVEDEVFVKKSKKKRRK